MDHIVFFLFVQTEEETRKTQIETESEGVSEVLTTVNVRQRILTQNGGEIHRTADVLLVDSVGRTAK